MITTLVCALLMLVCAAILVLYPRGYNQYRHYGDEAVRRAYERHIRLWGGIGSMVIAVVLAAGALWIERRNPGFNGHFIFNMLTIIIGVIVMAGGIESFNKKRVGK